MLYGIAFHGMVLYDIVLYDIVLYEIAMYDIVMYECHVGKVEYHYERMSRGISLHTNITIHGTSPNSAEFTSAELHLNLPCPNATRE